MAIMLYHFQIELSDIDRAVYASLNFRIAQHPSEIPAYLLSRTLAYALSFEQGLEFSAGGLADPEAPAMSLVGRHGAIDHWIEIGNPSARKLHKATKAATRVSVFTYKSADVLKNEIQNNGVHRGHEIEIRAFDPKLLLQLERHLIKNNKWSLMVQNDHLDIGIGSSQFSGDVTRTRAN